MTEREAEADAFIRSAGWEQASRRLLAGDASNRRYDRLTLPDGNTAVFMDAPAEKGEDVRPFVKVAEYLTGYGLSAPRILAQDATHGFLLIEDLGDALFARLMEKDPTLTALLYAAATDALIALHQSPNIPLAECDTDWLVQATEICFEYYAGSVDAFALFEKSFRQLARGIDAAPRVVILRDFHAENLLWLPERAGVARVGLLDFQDALLGHPAYDLVSILQDARRDLSTQIEDEMIARYILQTHSDAGQFHDAYALLGLQRNLRILGIFARLCLRDAKPHYVDLIPRVWGYVQRNLEHPRFHDLSKLLRDALPNPTPDFLKELKSRCATHPTP